MDELGDTFHDSEKIRKSIDEMDDDEIMDEFFCRRTTSYSRFFNADNDKYKDKTFNRMLSQNRHQEITSEKLFKFISDEYARKSPQCLKNKMFDVVVTLLSCGIKIIDNLDKNDISIQVTESDIWFPNVRCINAYKTHKPSFSSFYDIAIERQLRNHYVLGADGYYYSIHDIIDDDFKNTKFLKFLRDYIEHNDIESLMYNASELYDAHQSYLEMMKVIGNV